MTTTTATAGPPQGHSFKTTDALRVLYDDLDAVAHTLALLAESQSSIRPIVFHLLGGEAIDQVDGLGQIIRQIEGETGGAP